MDKIGSSYIALPDLIIVGVATALYWYLTNLPPNSLITRVLALVCGFVIVSIIAVMSISNDLTSSGVHMLAYVGGCLAFGLWRWNRSRIESKLTPSKAG